ncbi:unnamed protein product [Adineta steineri]|uniref:AAA+ ATPase domain-containing protein n=1 Tax=Adineta steineri TaxID=433720 RepID=A0A815JTY8_9BILA|nr:unnamed protein product [Adineta steineri]CAF3866070.1 unnamed protein product [Adineta steineri]
MELDDIDQIKIVPFNTTTRNQTPSSISTSATTRTNVPAQVTSIASIVLNVYLKYDYSQLTDFANELTRISKYMKIGDQSVSILHLYAIKSTKNPIDMSSQSIRKVYRPNLSVRKNDAFGAWNFKFLLNLLEIDYCCSSNQDFPEVWKTTDQTRVTVNVIQPKSESMSISTSNIDSSNATEKIASEDEESFTLHGILVQICRQNNYDDAEATLWLNKLKEERITNLEHLKRISSSSESWEKVSAIKQLPKQMIRDYLQLNILSKTSNDVENPYENSVATLIGDIHRVRRAVDLAIEEVRRSYDDDGNILENIQNYLRTFCLRNTIQSESAHEGQRKEWQDEVDETTDRLYKNRQKLEEYRREYEKANKDVNDCLDTLQRQRSEMIDQKRKLQIDLDNKRSILRTKMEPYLRYATMVDNDEKKIQYLKELLKIDLVEEHKKLLVKFGRGLLLYGPPGTGKSELLKRVAIYAGITMTTVPLAAGELNRPYVGETEKLLIDIMYRSNTIPYLICAMTIDEIDGLVPKRDNNAQQSKVDGISVLLSHIEGVKNIPNLIVFGATNRRNMMDEAFLRRMQAKVFVGRPSPQVRKKMLRPLLVKDSTMFTSQCIDFLVKITTNFSGAAVGALKSSIIVAMENQSHISDDQLLELADNSAREFNCWFGISTLPEICRLHQNMFNPQGQEEYSLSLPEQSPTGRILVDLLNKKCLIEFTNEPTLEKDLRSEETSTLSLLGRFINGCSSRNIDTIQIIDLNFLTKQNAFDENQKFELLTATFGECNEYDRSMLIFDIDSLVALNVSDSDMSKSLSISNIALYQFIREKCKIAVVEQKKQDKNAKSNSLKEKWIVMIVKHPFLLNTIIEDIEFKKTQYQIQEEESQAQQKLDEETAKKCPKCLHNYIPSKINYGSCHYHDGFVYDLDNRKRMTPDEAQQTMQKARLTNRNMDQQPKLIWGCCLGIYGHDPPCQTGICGLPDELKKQSTAALSQEDMTTLVQQHFMKNRRAQQKIDAFAQSYAESSRNAAASASSSRIHS